MGRDTDATGGSANGGNGEGNENEGRGSRESGRDFGGLGYGSAVAGGLGLGGMSSAVADTVGREAFGGLAGSVERGGFGGGSEAPSYGSADAAYSRSVHTAAPDMSDRISSMVGKQVTRTDVGYMDDVGARMAYSSGNPTSHGAAAAGREANSMSWQGGSMMSAAAQDSRVSAKNAMAREIQDRVARTLKDPMSIGLDPHQAFAAYNDAMHGMYDKAVAVGAMTPQEARTVQEAYGGIGGAFGIGLQDVTTPYESFVDSVEQGLVDPKTGSLTAKGWANVASPVLGMLAGPLTQVGFNLAGIPGAVIGALAPGMAKAAVSPQQSTGLNTAVNAIGKVTGVDAGPLAAGMSYAKTMNTMSRAQDYAGTKPGSVSGVEGHGGNEDGALPGFRQFFTGGKEATAAPATSQAFQQAGKWGKRADGTEKGDGYFGPVQMQDGSDSVATEISVGVNIGGQEMEIPTLVPTLTKQEMDYLLKGNRPTDAIVKKAVDHAKKRIAAGKSPFAAQDDRAQQGDVTKESVIGTEFLNGFEQFFRRT